MRLNKFFVLSFVLLSACACREIKYEHDFAYTISAKANSPEFMIKINGKTCKDIDGQIGACVKRVRANENIDIEIMSQPYQYEFILDCTDSIKSDITTIVNSETVWHYIIDATKYNDVRGFSCTVDVNPQDRTIVGDDVIQAFAAFRIIVVDADYQPYGLIYKDVENGTTVFGKYAYHVKTLNNGVWFDNKMLTGTKNNVDAAIVESHNMRIGYYGDI